MSLINEALKKAQRQRSLDNAPLSSAPSGVAAAAVTTHVRAASHRRSYAPVYFGLGLLVLGVVSTVLIMRYGLRSDSSSSVVEVPVRPPVAPVTTPVAVAPVGPAGTGSGEAAAASNVTVSLPAISQVTKASTETPLPSSVSPATTQPSAPPSPQPTLPLAAPSVSPAAVAATELAAPVPPPSVPLAVSPPPPPPPKPTGPSAAEREARAQEFINTLRLTGVRGLGAQARVLMNEKVYRLNDTVEPSVPLRLSAVRPGLLVFTDGKGRTYEKTY